MSTRSIPVRLGSWIAAFLDGPLAGVEHDRHFAVGPIHRQLFLMPHPNGKLGYALVGWEGMNPEEPWPGQVQYDYHHVAHIPGEPPVAYYRLVVQWRH